MPNDQPDWVSPTAQVQREIGSLTPAASATLTQSFPVPTECQALGFLVDLKNGIFIPTNLTVQGDQTGVFYFNTATPTGIVNLEHRALADTSVTMSVTSPAAGAAKVRLLAFTAHPIVSVRNVSNTPLTVDVTDRAGRILGDIVDRATRLLGLARIQTSDGVSLLQGGESVNALRVTHFNSTPAPWQAPSSIALIDIPAGLAVNGTQTIVAAVVNQTVRLHGYHLETDAASSVGIASLEDTGGGVRDKIPLTAVPLALVVDFKGIALPVGTGVLLANRGSIATAAIRGSLTFDQR